jgi:hypothetical protein
MGTGAAEVKNGDERLVVLDRVAKSVIDSVLDEHDEYVFRVPRSTDRDDEQQRVGSRRASVRD